jgi:hypothetical protein
MLAEQDSDTIVGSLNFAADRTDGGIWSNLTPEITTQRLAAHAVRLTDARTLRQPPSLDREGFVVAPLAVGTGNYTDASWVEGTYIPACAELVKALSGADAVVPLHAGVLIRDTGNPHAAPAAEFVHLDHTRAAIAMFLRQVLGDDAPARYRQVRVYNVWRALTPPPQDVPLALCDQRTLDRDSWVVGRTVEPGYEDGVPYISSVYDPDQRWCYFSDVGADEAIVFKGYDSDPDAPYGCMHGAFRHDTVTQAGGAVPRASAETRIFALYA